MGETEASNVDEGVIVKFVSLRLRLLLTALAGTAVAVSTAAASPSPRYVYRDVAFVTLNGRGTVRSTPRGIACPRRCRGVFLRGTHVVLRAAPAAGWRLGSFTSKWCTATAGVCGFDLVSPHDCSGGACPLGAFGVRVTFVRSS
jgi:hypothetical protein